MFISKVTGYVIDNYIGSTDQVAQAKIEARADTRTVQYGIAPGFELNAANGEKLIIEQMGNSSRYLIAIAGTNQNIQPNVDRGERRIYSVSSDGIEIKAIAKFKNDGTLELNGASDSAVLFSELKTAYDNLKADFNNLVSAYNAHTHIASSFGAPTTTPSSPGSASTASVDAAESADVKLS